jgi:HPt (histidine-containing phosphotransfer) domain-containing protein
MPTTASTAFQPLTSTLAGDPDFTPLLVLFVEELKIQVAHLEQAVAAADHRAVHNLAHMIKGSAGSYGFNSVTDAARNLDELAKGQGSLDSLTSSFNELRRLCDRIRV